MVGILKLFGYADWLDIILMMIGLIAAVANGTGLPLIIVVIGEMTNRFVTIGQAVNLSSGSLIYWIGRGSGWSAAVVTIQVWTFLTSAARQTARIRQKFFFAVLHQEMAWYDTSQTGTLNTRLTDDINTIHEGIGDKFCIFVQFFATFLTGIVIGFVYGWKLTLVILSVSTLLTAAAAFMASFTTKELTAYARAGAVAEEILTAIRTVVPFNGQMKALAKYDVNLENARKVGVKKSITSYTSLGFTEFISFGAFALAFWYGTKLTVEERENYDLGCVLIVLFSLLRGAFFLGQGYPYLESVANARGAAYEVYKVISKVLNVAFLEGYRPDKLKGDIEFKNIHFCYPSRPDVKILKGLNLKVQSGKTIALVGSSGCGKSTAIQLLQRFYDPVQGEITLDGRDIRTLNIKWLREHIGLVSQEPILFATTIAENICCGREGITDYEIEKAAKEANAFDFISRLPDKFNTMVGERGAQLSGGQKQRIAIARALARNPRILLLDEATSALDTQSESIVQAALDKARTGRTTIVIAHRLSTIRTADIIAGFHNGGVVEQGTHNELMTQKGVYSSLVMQQNQESLRWEAFLRDPEGIKAERPLLRKSRLKRRRKQRRKRLEENLPAVPYSRILALNKPEWLHIFFGVIAAAFSGGIYPAFSVLYGKIIGVNPEKRSKTTTLLSLMFLVLAVISLVTHIIQGFMFGNSGEVLTKRLRSLSFKALLQQEIGWYDDPKNAIGVLLTRLATDASQVKGATGSRLGLFTKTASTLLTAIIIAFVYDWRLTLLIVACVPFIIAASAIRLSSVAGQASKDQKALEEAGRISMEAVENIRTVASLTSEDAFYERYNTSLNGPYRDSLTKAPLYGLTYGIAQCAHYFLNAAIFRFGAWLIANCYTNFENVFIAFLSVLYGVINVGQSSSLAPDFGKAKVSSQRIFQLLDRKPLIDSYSEEGTKLSQFDGNIEFRDIHFIYPTRPEAQVLQGLSVKVNKGQTLALVGSSGCGKSTSIQLLERFYDPMAGQVGMIFPFFYNSRVVSQEEVEEAAKAANIHTFIENLPEKYTTRVGDKGAQLSGGQKQRIAIARALVRKPAVLLLDEATSALDTESEKIVQKALDDARKGRTCIIIAHRLTTVQNADVIAVIHNGKVVEQGTHSQLLAKEGHYYALVNAQVSH
uniref:ATP-binding cassette sub-family B member 5 n=1 Tax=Terrapene triunguis TaxID=2587831 RepID=A0A674I9R1_9SAUR